FTLRERAEVLRIILRLARRARACLHRALLNVWCMARTGVKNRGVLLNPLTRVPTYCIFLNSRQKQVTLPSDDYFGLGSRPKEPPVKLRFLGVSPLDPSSSPSGLRIVDLIAMSDWGDVGAK